MCVHVVTCYMCEHVSYMYMYMYEMKVDVLNMSIFLTSHSCLFDVLTAYF